MVVSTLNEYNGVLYPTYEQLPQTDVAQNDSKKRDSGGVAISNCLHAYSQPNKALYLSNDPIEGRVLLAMSLGLLTGLIQILFSILHIGVFTKYLSDSIVNGFTIGAAYHVVVSQLYTLLGIKPNDLHTPFIIIGVCINQNLIVFWFKITLKKRVFPPPPFLVQFEWSTPTLNEQIKIKSKC